MACQRHRPGPGRKAGQCEETARGGCQCEPGPLRRSCRALAKGRRRADPAPETIVPQPFATKDGKRKGLEGKIPGDHALATPAVVQGKLFIGGGFGSHEFYGFDAQTGKMLWRYQTSDDGPTAAVVADGCVAFNTESCELEIVTAGGKPVWKKWLGDPR